jgi:hypothetical protein
MHSSPTAPSSCQSVTAEFTLTHPFPHFPFSLLMQLETIAGRCSSAWVWGLDCVAGLVCVHGKALRIRDFRFRLFCNRRSDGQSGWRPVTRFLLLSGICGLRFEGRSPWREDDSTIYSYNLLSLSGPSPSELMTTSHCLIWDSPNLEGQVPVFISSRNRMAQSYSPGTGFPFCRLLRLARLRWRYYNSHPHGSAGNRLLRIRD